MRRPFPLHPPPAIVDPLAESTRRFRALPREMRLQRLLQYANRFPELPDELREARDAGLGRIEECQTPLFLWVAVQDGAVRIHADAPRESPTVRGFVGFLVESLDGATPAEVARVSEGILEDMGLGEALGMVRTRGLSAVVRRLKADVARAAA